MILLKFFQENRIGNIINASLEYNPTELEPDRKIIYLELKERHKQCRDITIPYNQWVEGFNDQLKS